MQIVELLLALALVLKVKHLHNLVVERHVLLRLRFQNLHCLLAVEFIEVAVNVILDLKRIGFAFLGLFLGLPSISSLLGVAVGLVSNSILVLVILVSAFNLEFVHDAASYLRIFQADLLHHGSEFAILGCIQLNHMRNCLFPVDLMAGHVLFDL